MCVSVYDVCERDRERKKRKECFTSTFAFIFSRAHLSTTKIHYYLESVPLRLEDYEVRNRHAG